MRLTLIAYDCRMAVAWPEKGNLARQAMAVFVLLLVLVPADRANARILCSAVSTVATIDGVSARPSVASFMSIFPVRCHNTGPTEAREMILVSIDTPEQLFVHNRQEKTLPVHIAFGPDIGPAVTHLCREVALAAGEHVTFDLTVIIRFRVVSQHHGTYLGATPVTVTTRTQHSNITDMCPR
jgi:hypothetical protein